MCVNCVGCLINEGELMFIMNHNQHYDPSGNPKNDIITNLRYNQINQENFIISKYHD